MMQEARDFVRQLPQKARNKVIFNMHKIEQGIIDVRVFKKLEGTDIWEIRTQHDGTAYRLFAFWDTSQGALIVATHGMEKKTEKTPPGHIEKAKRLRREYFNSK